MNSNFELYFALCAIEVIKDNCDYKEVEEFLNNHITEDEKSLLSDFVETINFTNEDVLLSAIEVVKKSIKEIKGE